MPKSVNMLIFLRVEYCVLPWFVLMIVKCVGVMGGIIVGIGIAGLIRFGVIVSYIVVVGVVVMAVVVGFVVAVGVGAYLECYRLIFLISLKVYGF